MIRAVLAGLGAIVLLAFILNSALESPPESINRGRLQIRLAEAEALRACDRSGGDVRES